MENLPADPAILMSYINTKLRDKYKTLDDLCEDMDIPRPQLEQCLSEAGFEYSPENNKFW